MNYKMLGPCLLAIAIDAMGFGLVYPIITAILNDAHSGLISSTISTEKKFLLVAIAFAIYPFFMFFGSPLMGELSDILGRKKVLIGCIFGLGISYGLMAIGIDMHNFLILIIGRGLGGLMAGCQGIAQAAVVDSSTVDTKAINMSRMSIAFSAGIVIGPLLGGITSDKHLSPWFGYATPFIIVCIIAIFCTCWMFISFSDKAIQPEPAQKKISIMTPILIIIEAAQHSTLRRLMISFFCMQIGYSLYFQTIQLLLEEKFAYGSLILGIFSGLIGICFVIGLTVVVGRMLRRYSVRKTCLMGLYIAGIAQILSALFPSIWCIWILAIVIGIFDMVSYTTMLTGFSDAVDLNRQGWALGITGSVMAFAWVITGLMANLSPILGNISLILIGGIFWLISALLLRETSVTTNHISPEDATQDLSDTKTSPKLI